MSDEPKRNIEDQEVEPKDQTESLAEISRRIGQATADGMNKRFRDDPDWEVPY
jgi:hypothetical protein